VCVCVSVIALTAAYLHGLYVENKVLLRLSCQFHDLCGFRGKCFQFVKKSLWQHLLTMHHCFLCFLMSSRSMKGTAIASFVDLATYTPPNLTDSSLFTVDYQLCSMTSLCTRSAESDLACYFPPTTKIYINLNLINGSDAQCVTIAHDQVFCVHSGSHATWS
jgi:hypothetical protein